MGSSPIEFLSLPLFITIAAIASGYQLAKLCPGDQRLHLAWAFILGNGLFVICLWNLSWLGIPVARSAWPLLAGLPIVNLAIEFWLRWKAEEVSGERSASISFSQLAFLAPVAIAMAWQVIPLMRAGADGVVIYDSSEFHTNAGIAEWLSTHGLSSDPESYPANSASWGAMRHLSLKLRIGQQMYHALLIAVSGQSATATWPVISGLIVAILATAALVLAMYATGGRILCSVVIACFVAAHPLAHAACLTSYISMAMGMAFLVAASALVFASGEKTASSRMAAPMAVCIIALLMVYQEILPTLIIMAGLFWTIRLWSMRKDFAEVISLVRIIAIAAVGCLLISIPGIIWGLHGLVRQMSVPAHGSPPALAPQMLGSLVTGLAQLPGGWDQLDVHFQASAVRWLAIAIVLGGLVATFLMGKRKAAPAAVLGGAAMLFILVLKRGGPPDFLDYGLSRAILYPGYLILIFGLSGWAAEPYARRLVSPAMLGLYGFALFNFSPRYFSNVLSAGDTLVLQSVSKRPAWVDHLPPDSITLFDAPSRDRLFAYIPYWHWLSTEAYFDTFLPPTPTRNPADSAQMYAATVGCIVTTHKSDWMKDFDKVAGDGRVAVYVPRAPFLCPMDLFDTETEGRALPRPARQRATALGSCVRKYWLCIANGNCATAELDMTSSGEQTASVMVDGFAQTVHFSAGTPVRLEVALNPNFHIHPIEVDSRSPILVSLGEIKTSDPVAPERPSAEKTACQ
jgi:hypothetical protein